jgi:hypothetical protein
MPIALDTPLVIPPRHDASGDTYNEVSISRFSVDLSSGAAYIQVEYGNTVGGEWEAADAVDPQEFEVIDHDDIYDPLGNLIKPASTAYSQLISTLTPAAGVPVYGVVKVSLYQWLIANVSAYAGTIV